MEEKSRYYKLSEYYKHEFGEKIQKICIDGSFTCPNRDGNISKGGCIFCSERGSGEHINISKNISSQVKNFFDSYKSERTNKFIAYFQNFSNTYDTIQNLKKKYDSALIDDRIIGLSIATRPDCIDEDIAKLLKSYTKKYYVCVELGLQTSNDETGKFINRGYTKKQFSKSVKLLNKYNIDVVTHIMVGLPNENENDLINTVNFINNHKIQGVKIHSTYIIENTKLCDLYKQKLYEPISFEYYMKSLCYIITHINPNIVIHRISGDPPKELLVAPEWIMHKKWVINGLYKKMKEENLFQGMYYEKNERI